MAVTPTFQSLVVEQLGRAAIPLVKARRMFGGVGIYSEQAFFALIADDTLYFKVDATTRSDFEARGMTPFRPFGEDGGEMQYFQVPEDVMEDLDALCTWATRAIAVARSKKRRGPGRRDG